MKSETPAARAEGTASGFTIAAVGVDIGARTTKAVSIDRAGSIVSSAIAPTGWSPAAAAKKVALQVDPEAASPVVATGFGRDTVETAAARLTEITCHAIGVRKSFPDALTVVDIGGQDSKVIRLDPHGIVADFAMNDRCAAGTGKFLEFLASTLGLSIEDFAALSEGNRPAQVSSMCTVFAETEVLDLVSSGVEVGEIVAGINRAVARRLASSMKQVGFEPPVVFSGGVALNRGVVSALSSILKIEVVVAPMPQFNGALGAALHGLATRG